MNIQTASYLLRIALAFSFFYPAIAGFIVPQNWIGYFPPFLLNTFPETILLMVFGVFEIILGLWILSGWKPVYANVIACAVLLLIVVFNASQIDIVFRDISLALVALALIALNRENGVIHTPSYQNDRNSV